jgi:hypothetical protein
MGTACPMLAFMDSHIQDALILWARVKRWNALPQSGGLNEQNALDLDTLDVIDAVMSHPIKSSE